MGNEVGRASFHVMHTKNVAERGAILDEMMRELNDESIERWAERNSNIVVDDEYLNMAFVNVGEDELVPCTDPKQVVEYGERRLARLSSPVREGKVDPVTGKVKGATTTTSLFVLHLPKSLCREVPDFYPVFDDAGNEIGRRSRWVARDRDEALQYFEDAMEFMVAEVIPGGRDAVLGADIQFSESTPHLHVLADTFAPDPRPGHEGKLRCDFSRAYGSHRAVRDEHGRQMSGQAKFRKYHDDFKQYMIERGWEIERDVDPLRHDKTATKEAFGQFRDFERALSRKSRVLKDDVRQSRIEFNKERKEIEEERKEVEEERKKVAEERKTAREKGRAEGFEKGRVEGFEKGRVAGFEKGHAEGVAETERLQEVFREKAIEAQKAAQEAAQHLARVKTSRPLSGEQARAFFMNGVQLFAGVLIRRVNDPAVKALIGAKQQECLSLAESEGFVDHAKSVNKMNADTRTRTLDRRQHGQTVLERHLKDLPVVAETPVSEQDEGYEF